MSSKNRLHMQNQDLIKTYNSLTYDNTYLKNILKTYGDTMDEEDKNCIFNNTVNAKQFSRKLINLTTDNSNFMNDTKN